VWSVPQVVDVPLDPATITGPVVFRTHVDDAAKLAQASFSLDGGATFQSPFPPTPVFQDTTMARVLLGADPHAAPSLPTTTIRTSTTTTTTLPGCQATPFRVRRASIVLDFAREGRDAVSLTGTLPLPGVVAAGQTVTVDVGGVQRTFQLDATGRGRVGRDRIRRLLIARVQRFDVEHRPQPRHRGPRRIARGHTGQHEGGGAEPSHGARE